MSDFLSPGGRRASVSLSAWKIEQLASRLCLVQQRGPAQFCATHGNVVATGSSMCSHVRDVVDQVVAVVLAAQREITPPPALTSTRGRWAS